MNRLRQYADLPIRLIVGFHLIYGTQDNVFSWNRMLEFKDFLEVYGTPFPLTAAVVSVYAQFFCGIMYIVGWKIKYAAIVMTFNFIVAILLVHLNDPYPAIYPAISMLGGSVFLILFGSGSMSIDEWWRNKKGS